MNILALILGIFFSTTSFAEIYKCTNANGKTNYQERPCDSSFKTTQLHFKTGNSSSEIDIDAQQQELTDKEAIEKLEEEKQLKKLTQLKQDAMAESAKNQFLVKNNPEKFSIYSIPPYDFDQLSPLVQNYQSRLPDVEKLRRYAAEKALESDHCNRVEASELEEKSNKKSLFFAVSCSSGKIFQFSEQELIQ